MVQVTIGDNTHRKNVIVDPHKTVGDILRDNSIDFGRNIVACNGETLAPEDFGKPLSEIIGDADSCYLLSVAKIDNGRA